MTFFPTRLLVQSRASWRERGIAILRKLMRADGAKAIADGGARPDSLRESGGSGGFKAIIADIESGELDSAEAVETDVTGLLDDFINGFDEGEPLWSTASLLRDAWDKGWAGQEMPELPKASSAAAAAAAGASADGGGSNGSGSGGKAEWNKESAAALLQKLMKHKEARPFLKPVNPAELGIDDYFDVIESPMDLGTVKQRLEKGEYAAPLDYAKDIRLTFRNAMTYNPKGDSVHTAARRLLNSFEDGYREVTQAPSASSGKDEKGGKDKDRDRDDDSDDDKAALPVNPDCRACMGKHVAHSCGRGKVVPASKGGGPGGPAAPPKPKVVTRVDPNHAAQYLHAVSESGWRGGALMLLQMIEEHESSWPFMGPFQGTDEEMRRYAATVKRPMDLSTVVEKIRGGSYARGGRKEFLRDIRSVFFNAMLVHTKEDEKYTMALELSDMFEEEWAAVMSINDRLQASGAGVDDYEGGGGGNDGRGGDDSAPKVDIAEVAAVARSSGSMWRTDCASCLDRLRQHPSSWAFLDGGGVSGGGLDLTTIGKNLEQGLYETSDLFADDIRSVFGAVGAGKGGAGGEVVTIAETMLKEFESDWGQLSSKWATEVRLVGANGAGGSKLGGEEQTMLKRELAIKEKILTVIKDVASAVSGAASTLDEVKQAAGEYGHPAEFARDAHAALKKWGEAGGGGGGSSSAAALSALDDAVAKHLAYPKDGGVAGIVAKSALRGPSGERPPRWFSECERCLSDVAASPSSWMLAVCVDLSQPGWIRQLEDCPRPMDILAISNKLDAGWYTGPSPFVMDLKHAVSNAKRNLGSQKEAAMGIIDNLLGIANRSIVLRDDMDSKASERLSRSLTNNGSVEDVDAWLGSGIMLTETTTKACLDVLSELILRPSSWPFRKSPSGGLEGLAVKLKAGSFASVLHFVAEFRNLLSPIIAAGGVGPGLAGAGNAGRKLPAKFGAGVASSGEPGEYVADEDETPRGIAKKLKVSADDLVQLNKPTYPKIFVNSRLLQGTVLQVPASHGDAGSSSASAPPSESQPSVEKKHLMAGAALGLLRYGELRLKSLMAPPEEQKKPEATKAPAAPAVKIRKGGKFLFTKMGKVMSAVRKTLEAMLRLDQAEAIMSFAPTTNARATKLPPALIDINTVRVSLELGVYCNSDDVVSEVKQVLQDSYDRAGAAKKASVKSLQEWFDKEVGDALALAMLPEGGENVSLAEKENMLRATAVLERSMKRPQCELFLEPVDPDEDGCPDYLDIIKDPMDFGTVKENLEAGHYGTIAEMCQHIRLVFSNAKTFNADGSPIHNNALEAEALFEADLAEILNLSPEELVPPDADACCVCGLSRGMQPCQGACGRQIHGEPQHQPLMPMNPSSI